LWNLGLDKKALLSYAREMGSDVSFFIHDISWGLGTERGDNIKKIYNKNKCYHILVVPRIKVYSGEVYSGLKLRLTKINDNASILIHNLRKNAILQASELIINDLEQAVFDICPNLLGLKKRLKSLGFKGVMVSGSGPAVFGLAENKKQAEYARKVLAKKYSQVFVVETL
jgi:4-diphosphocytidyl-2-C-methyl-D-erythritol kinase